MGEGDVLSAANDLDALEAMEARWTAGGLALGSAPPDWRALAKSTNAPELTLVALAGEAARTAQRPLAPDTLSIRPPLPRLALPTVPQGARAAFRAALGTNPSGALQGLVLSLLASRGWSAHPLDWMPAGTVGASLRAVPEMYGPWASWVAGWAPAADAPVRLDEASWDDLTPAPRRMMLADLRREDPAAARALMEAKLAALPAEQRADMLTAMGVGLSADDAPFLRSLGSDRSARVREAAARMLARLGEGEGARSEAGDTVREAIEIGSAGLLRRRRVFKPSKARKGQRHARLEALAAMPLAAVAAALDVAPRELLAGWQWGEDDGFDQALARSAARSADDATFADMLARVMQLPVGVTQLAAFAPRLDEGQWREAIETVIGAPPKRQPHPRGIIEAMAEVPPAARSLGGLTGPALHRGGTLALALAAAAPRTPPGKGYDHARAVIDRAAPDRLAVLGLLAAREDARMLIETARAAGFGRADPALALLRLNAALPPAPDPAQSEGDASR